MTYNSKLNFSSDEERDSVLEVLEYQRFAYNECSKIKFERKLKNSIVDLHAIFYRSFRDCQPKIPAQVVIRAEQEVLSAYRSVKSNKHKISGPISKKRLSMRLDKRIYSCKNGVFSIISSGKRAKATLTLFPKLTEMLENYKFLDPLIFEKNGDLWMAVTFDVPEKPLTQTLACGVDLGVRVSAATSEGRIYRDKPFRSRKRRTRYNKRQLQKRQTKNANRKLKKLRRKESRQARDFSHRLVNFILKDTEADVIVIEELKGLTKGRGKKGTKQVQFYGTRRILEYKAALLSKPKTVITINPAYTSQLDSFTGTKGERRGRRFYSNGRVLDADVNAAVNIAARSKLPVSRGNVLDGQAEVIRPIACQSFGRCKPLPSGRGL